MNYLTYEHLVAMHVYLMRDMEGETYYGISDKGALDSALMRPRQAVNYEQAGGLRQSAYLFHGLLMNHGFAQGNKRTAYLALEWFLDRNELGHVTATDEHIIQMCFSAENEKWTVDQLEQWLVEYTSAGR